MRASMQTQENTGDQSTEIRCLERRSSCNEIWKNASRLYCVCMWRRVSYEAAIRRRVFEKTNPSQGVSPESRTHMHAVIVVVVGLGWRQESESIWSGMPSRVRARLVHAQALRKRGRATIGEQEHRGDPCGGGKQAERIVSQRPRRRTERTHYEAGPDRLACLWRQRRTRGREAREQYGRKQQQSGVASRHGMSWHGRS